jgi:hypothetical protein
MNATIGADTVEVQGSEIVVTIDGIEYREDGFRPGACMNEKMELAAALSFLSASGDSYRYNGRKMKECSNTDLFCETVVEWAYKYYDELCMAELDLEEKVGE